METKWISFELDYDSDYNARYTALTGAVLSIDSGAWGETTSFYFVRTSMSAQEISQRLGFVISHDRDIVLVGGTETKGIYAQGRIRELDKLKQSLGNLLYLRQ